MYSQALTMYAVDPSPEGQGKVKLGRRLFILPRVAGEVAREARRRGHAPPVRFAGREGPRSPTDNRRYCYMRLPCP